MNHERHGTITSAAICNGVNTHAQYFCRIVGEELDEDGARALKIKFCLHKNIPLIANISENEK